MPDLAAAPLATNPVDDRLPADSNDNGLRFIPSAYPGGRMVLRCGAVDVGAVFPPCGDPPNAWAWRVWITRDTFARDGRAKSEPAAKAAALAVFREFLTAAGLEVVNGG